MDVTFTSLQCISNTPLLRSYSLLLQLYSHLAKTAFTIFSIAIHLSNITTAPPPKYREHILHSLVTPSNHLSGLQSSTLAPYTLLAHGILDPLLHALVPVGAFIMVIMVSCFCITIYSNGAANVVPIRRGCDSFLNTSSALPFLGSLRMRVWASGCSASFKKTAAKPVAVDPVPAILHLRGGQQGNRQQGDVTEHR